MAIFLLQLDIFKIFLFPGHLVGIYLTQLDILSQCCSLATFVARYLIQLVIFKLILFFDDLVAIFLIRFNFLSDFFLGYPVGTSLIQLVILKSLLFFDDLVAKSLRWLCGDSVTNAYDSEQNRLEITNRIKDMAY